jgi:serine/threonine-protein kinase
MDDLSGRQFGAYRVIEWIDEGGMAAVYKAHQPSVDRHVALKILPRHSASDPQSLSRFKHEAKIVAQLQHPHVLSIFDFGETDGYPFLAMPFVHGGTLADLLKGQPLPLDVVMRVATQVCEALDYAHAKGIVHRDIKPKNILMDERGNCLVADFGIARMTDRATRLTMTGAIMGTPAYMSPEQVGGKPVSPQTDIYAFGIVLYEMLTGRVPFDGDTPVVVAAAHLHQELPSPRSLNPALTPALERVLIKALARRPEDRYSSARELLAALRTAAAAAADEATQVMPPASLAQATTVRYAGSAPARRPGAALWVVAGVVAVTGIVWLFPWSSNQSSSPPVQFASSPVVSTSPSPAVISPSPVATPTPTPTLPLTPTLAPTATPTATLTPTPTQTPPVTRSSQDLNAEAGRGGGAPRTSAPRVTSSPSPEALPSGSALRGPLSGVTLVPSPRPSTPPPPAQTEPRPAASPTPAVSSPPPSPRPSPSPTATPTPPALPPDLVRRMGGLTGVGAIEKGRPVLRVTTGEIQRKRGVPDTEVVTDVSFDRIGSDPAIAFPADYYTRQGGLLGQVGWQDRGVVLISERTVAFRGETGKVAFTAPRSAISVKMEGGRSGDTFSLYVNQERYRFSGSLGPINAISGYMLLMQKALEDFAAAFEFVRLKTSPPR